jgi:hypothetical protein
VKSLRSLASVVSAVMAMAYMGQPIAVHAATSQMTVCWKEVEAKYGISAQLLAGIAKVESNLRPSAVNEGHKLKTNSIDIGLTQINSRWLPKLSAYGITEKDLYDACTNLHVGGWILSDLLRKKGNTWDAVGAYNAACTQLKGDDCLAARSTYAWKVYKAMVKLNPANAGLPPTDYASQPSKGQSLQTSVQVAAKIKPSRIASLSLKEVRSLPTPGLDDEETLVDTNATDETHNVASPSFYNYSIAAQARTDEASE